MVYPSHYVSGEYGIVDPDSRPGTTVAYSLRDFREKLAGAQDQARSRGCRTSRSGARTRWQTSRTRSRPPGWSTSKGFLLWNAAGVYTVKALSTPVFR